MTGHLGLDDLASLVGSEVAPADTDHLAGCDICRGRLANLRARSAEVSVALGETVGDVGPMPTDVAERITAALTAAGRARPVDISVARERRSRRVRGWLVAAAAVVVVGGGFGAIVHFASGQSASSGTSGTSNTAAGAAATPSGPSADESLTAGATANPSAARGVLLEPSFAADAKAYVAARRIQAPHSQPLTTAGSSRCATLAGSQAAAIAGSNAAGGNPVNASAALIGPVTVDGRSGVLYLVDVGPVKVAIAAANCSTTAPDVLAGATL